MAVKQITPEEAKRLLDGEEEYVYVDVRSDFEFEQGHPSDSYNIPIKQLNPELRMLQENPDFFSVIEAVFPKDTNLILGCASGQRSNVAGMILEQHGYSNVSNVRSGFSGVRDMMGKVVEPGWMQLGYPVETGSGADRSYQTLLNRKNSR